MPRERNIKNLKTEKEGIQILRKKISNFHIPTSAELALRTLLAADYTIVGDLGTVQTGDSYAIVNGDHGLVSIQDDVDAILTDTSATLPTAAECATAVWAASNGTLTKAYSLIMEQILQFLSNDMPLWRYKIMLIR